MPPQGSVGVPAYRPVLSKCCHTSRVDMPVCASTKLPWLHVAVPVSTVVCLPCPRTRQTCLHACYVPVAPHGGQECLFKHLTCPCTLILEAWLDSSRTCHVPWLQCGDTGDPNPAPCLVLVPTYSGHVPRLPHICVSTPVRLLCPARHHGLICAHMHAGTMLPHCYVPMQANPVLHLLWTKCHSMDACHSCSSTCHASKSRHGTG